MIIFNFCRTKKIWRGNFEKKIVGIPNYFGEEILN